MPTPSIADVGLWFNYITTCFQPSTFISLKHFTALQMIQCGNKAQLVMLYEYLVVTRELVNDIFCLSSSGCITLPAFVSHKAGLENVH